MGWIAQLGERLPYKQDVGGSSPSLPIRLIRLTPGELVGFFFRREDGFRAE